MDIRKLQRAIVDGLEDVKAQNILVFNTEHLSALFERVIIATGSSNRQTKALASSVRETVKARGMTVLATEGAETGEWIIVDCGAAVAHIMQPAIRDYYHLEELWGEKSVRMKIAAGGPARLVKAQEPDKALVRKSARRSAAAPAAPPQERVRKYLTPERTAGGRPPAPEAARKAATPAARPPRPAAGKPAAGVAPTRDRVAGRAPAARKSASEKSVAGPATVRQVLVGKTPARKAAAGKTAARRVVAGKPAVRGAAAGSPLAGHAAKAPALKAAAGKAAAHKTAAGKTPARKTAAGKTPARKAAAAPRRR